MTPCYFPLRCLLRLFKKAFDCWILKSPGLGLFGKSGAENNNASCFLGSIFGGRWLPGLPGGFGKNELLVPSNVPQRASLELPDVLSMPAMPAFSSNGATRRPLGKKEHVRDV